MSWELGSVFTLVCLTILFFWQSAKFDENNIHRLLKLFMYLLGWLCIVITIGLTRLMIGTSAPTATGVLAIIDVVFYIVIVLFVVIFFYWLLNFVWEYWKGSEKYLFSKSRKRSSL